MKSNVFVKPNEQWSLLRLCHGENTKDEVQPSNEEKCHESIKEISIIIWASWRIIVMLLSLRFSFSLYMVHGSKIQNSLQAYMILLKLPMNKRIYAFASLHKAYMEPT